ncbi:MAG: DUF808 domain-containing protein [Pseudomonadota bacterium]
MSGLLALLDDVAAIAKLASAQLDDIVTQAAKAGTKTAGVVIDDAAVTPKYVEGLPAARELPIVWQIARASLFNKLVILLPIALLLSVFAPWMLPPLLMLGGAYLCYEGAEKIIHIFGEPESKAQEAVTVDAAHLERARVSGAIKTDFILSAEIMTIALASVQSGSVWMDGIVLAIVAIVITVVVYGSVALLVKADDLGVRLASRGHFSATRALGRGIVKAMPSVMATISTIGTAAMLWVGGSIIIHGLKELGETTLYAVIKDAGSWVASLLPAAEGLAQWMTVAGLDGIFGLAVGLVLVPVLAPFLHIKTAGAASSGH